MAGINVTSFSNCSFLYQGSLYTNFCAIDVCEICNGNNSTCICNSTRTTGLVLFILFTGVLLPIVLWILARYVAFPASRGSFTSFVVIMFGVTWAALALELIGLWLPVYEGLNVCDTLRNISILYAPACIVVVVALLWCSLGCGPSTGGGKSQFL